MKTSNEIERFQNKKDKYKLDEKTDIKYEEDIKKIRACIISKNYRERKKIKFDQLSHHIAGLENANFKLKQKMEILNNILFTMRYELLKAYIESLKNSI
jgi:hypothetical protein